MLDESWEGLNLITQFENVLISVLSLLVKTIQKRPIFLCFIVLGTCRESVGDSKIAYNFQNDNFLIIVEPRRLLDWTLVRWAEISFGFFGVLNDRKQSFKPLIIETFTSELVSLLY